MCSLLLWNYILDIACSLVVYEGLVPWVASDVYYSKSVLQFFRITEDWELLIVYFWNFISVSYNFGVALRIFYGLKHFNSFLIMVHNLVLIQILSIGEKHLRAIFKCLYRRMLMLDSSGHLLIYQSVDSYLSARCQFRPMQYRFLVNIGIF